MFSQKDIEQMNKKGIEPSVVEKQMTFFRNGFPFLMLDRPATVNDGIIGLSNNEAEEWARFYDKEVRELTIEKFVPASGAATRMFKDLYAFLEESPEKDLASVLEKNQPVKEVIEKRSEFAFYPELKKLCRCESVNTTGEAQQIVKAIITESGLNYGNLPKGLLAFHKYLDGPRTSFGEHLAECALYAKRGSGMAHVHFTVTPEHRELFKKLLKDVKGSYEKLYNTSYMVEFSEQSPSTDTIAVDMENNPFRDSRGELVFRPAGHGALLHNLNQLSSEIIFIKNIDNVVPDNIKNDTILYKKAIAGILINNVNTINDFLYKIEEGGIGAGLISEIRNFYKKNFFVDLPEDISVEKINQILNRPVRVCGMVKNQGEPGGGPFWVKGANGSPSLQVVESSQVEKGNAVFINSTHFNPVDLVCWVYNYKGDKFDLSRFSDPETGFISVKSKDGKDLKAMELPGLWNGAMADWNTVFVEVPLITFNPVKTINDLLRREHILQ